MSDRGNVDTADLETRAADTDRQPVVDSSGTANTSASHQSRLEWRSGLLWRLRHLVRSGEPLLFRHQRRSRPRSSLSIAPVPSAPALPRAQETAAIAQAGFLICSPQSCPRPVASSRDLPSACSPLAHSPVMSSFTNGLRSSHICQCWSSNHIAPWSDCPGPFSTELSFRPLSKLLIHHGAS